MPKCISPFIAKQAEIKQHTHLVLKEQMQGEISDFSTVCFSWKKSQNPKGLQAQKN